MENDRLLTTREAAYIVGLKPTTLCQDRLYNRLCIPYVRVGKKAVRYRLSELNQYIKGLKTQTNTSQNGI